MMKIAYTARPTAALLFLASFVLTSCDGPTGPPGPPGNANVHSLTFDFSMDDAQFNGPVASVQYDVSSITPSVVDHGAVLLYFREQETWTATPYTFAEESPDLPAVDFTITLGYGYDDAFLEVFYESSTTAIDLADQPDREMKAVIIDGIPLGKIGVDLTDYEAVRAHFGLPR